MPVVYAATVSQAQNNATTLNPMAQSMIWGQWVNQTQTATTTITITANVWNTWTSTSTMMSGLGGNGQSNGMLAPTPPTPEQLALVEQRQQAAAAETKRRDEAAARAKTLLRDNLTAAQLKALDKHGWFLVQGGKSGKLYRVRANSYAGNIYELDAKKKEVARYCVHMTSDIPLHDHLLAQALSLRFDEEHIIARANRTPLAA